MTYYSDEDEKEAIRERENALAEAHARTFCSAAIAPLAVFFVSFFLPTMTFFHDSGLPVFLLPLPAGLAWPTPLYLTAGALCVALIAERRGSPSRASRILVAPLLLISMFVNWVAALAALAALIMAERVFVLAAPLLLFSMGSLWFYVRAERYKGMRRAAFLLFSFALPTTPLGAAFTICIIDEHVKLRWGGYITFITLIAILLLASVAILPPSVLSRYREPRR